MKILNFNKGRKEILCGVAKVHVSNESSLLEIVDMENEMHAHLALTSHTAKAVTTVCRKGLGEMEKG